MSGVQKLRAFFRAIKPIALSHHPLCPQFQDGTHTFTLFGREWCIGCFVTYPTAAVIFLFGTIAGIFSQLPTKTLWIIGFSLCGVYILSIVGLTKRKPVKIITKVFIGGGIAFCLGALWSLPYSFAIRLLLSMIFFQIGHFFINSMRGIAIYRICHQCEFDGDWHTCPGMGSILNPEGDPNQIYPISDLEKTYNE